MSLESLLAVWRNTAQVSDNIITWETIPERIPRFAPIPNNLHPELTRLLKRRGFFELYSHQVEAWQAASQGRSLVVVTGTASGKTLCYTLPVLDRLLKDPQARALLLFPTKALAQDQLAGLRSLWEGESDLAASIGSAIYDGDTPRPHRSEIRSNARLVLSNPDMFHTGILPYHTQWAQFFRSLAFIVIDEMHIYRGVFGSHVANVLRRIRRIAAFYGAAPRFILTSATIANPLELAEKLVEEPVVLINQDGSGRGAKHFLVYNPPIVNAELGIRRNVMQESVFLASDLQAYGVQTILFARSRRAVELTLAYLRERSTSPGAVRAYRSGYLPVQRREIEAGLRDGSVELVAATNALELGIDIGGMDAVLLVGFPGSIAAAWQQAGRAGRGRAASLAVLLTSANPLDQFLARHPEYFFGRSPEQALINPDNLLILLDHLRCAAFELPFRAGEGFGRVEASAVEALLSFLVNSGVLHFSRSQYYWMAGEFPAQRISLRNASARRVLLQAGGKTIGEVDQESATWMAHPGAVYLHEGQSFLVESLNQEEGFAQIRPADLDYFTEPLRDETVALVSKLAEEPQPGGFKAYGEVRVTSQVTGFRKIHWETRMNLATEPLDMPPAELETTGYWLTLDEPTLEKMRAEGAWRSDPNDYGPGWLSLRALVRQRDEYRCQVCGAPENGRAHDVHHKIPFRTFQSAEKANELSNLVTLCPACHRRAETVVRVRSGLSGLGFILGQLAPLYLMCDQGDVGVIKDSQSPLADGLPAVVIYDRAPGGIGFSERLYEIHAALLAHAYEVISQCPCKDGCPSCVGPGGEGGFGGKDETLDILKALGVSQ